MVNITVFHKDKKLIIYIKLVQYRKKSNLSLVLSYNMSINYIISIIKKYFITKFFKNYVNSVT